MVVEVIRVCFDYQPITWVPRKNSPLVVGCRKTRGGDFARMSNPQKFPPAAGYTTGFKLFYCAKHPCSLWEKVGLYVCPFVCLYGFPASFVGAEKTWAHVLLSTQSLKSEF